MNSHTPNIASRIKELRIQKGLTQKELAAEIGLGYGTIIGYENGQRKPSFKAMAALEQYFGVSGAYLRGEEAPAKGCAQQIKEIADTILSNDQLLENGMADALRGLTLQMKKNCNEMVELFSSLTVEGQQVMLDRLQEYKIVDDAKRDAEKASSSKDNVG